MVGGAGGRPTAQLPALDGHVAYRLPATAPGLARLPATTRRSNSERREQSTELVLEAALRRFVERGYRATSIDDIARDAGLTGRGAAGRDRGR